MAEVLPQHGFLGPGVGSFGWVLWMGLWVLQVMGSLDGSLNFLGQGYLSGWKADSIPYLVEVLPDL